MCVYIYIISLFIYLLIYFTLLLFTRHKSELEPDFEGQGKRRGETYHCNYPISCLFSLSAKPVAHINLIKYNHHFPQLCLGKISFFIRRRIRP